jgi:MFS transporter, PAT family, beta-lactamase induction signal transducer AmpG
MQVWLGMIDGGAKKRPQLPPWAMGLAIAPMGCYYGFISTAMGILLRARGVPVERIDYISAIAFSPSFWAFLLCPILDVRFSKRAYAVLFAGLAAVCLGVTTLLTANLTAFTVVLTIGCAAAVIFGNAHQGWMPDVIGDKHYSHVGATTNVANLGAAGAFAVLTVYLVRDLPALSAAALLALTMAAPAVLLFFIPLPARPTRGASQVFSTFFRDLYTVCKRRDCIIGLICFAAPTACFALTNSFSSLGSDFRATEAQVTAINGTGVAITCSIGCLAGIWFCNRFARRNVYILTGFLGAAAALTLLATPHALAWYVGGVLAYNFFQGVSYTAFSSFCYEIVGPESPLAGTQMALLAAAANLPISYMTAIEGHAHSRFGLGGMLMTDAVSTLIVGTTVLFALRHTKLGRAPIAEPVRN